MVHSGVPRALSGLLFVVAATACDCGNGGGVGTGRCATAADCAAGQACVDGVCVSRPGTDGGEPPGSDGGSDVDAGPRPGECRVPPSASPFENPARELRWRGEGLPFPDMEQAIVSPIVIDWIEDGPDDRIPEIVFVSYRDFNGTGVLRVVSGRAPHETRMTLAGDGSGPAAVGSPAVPSLRFDSHPAAGDLDGDGHPEVVAVLAAGGAVAWHRDGAEMWRTTFPVAEYGANASVAIADLEHDGMPEVIIGRVVIDGQSGMVRWTGTGGRGSNGQGPLSCVADLDGVGAMEVIAGNTVYDATGGIVWQAPATTGDGFCAIADVSDAMGGAARDGTPEVIRVANGRIFVHDGATGAVRFMAALPACNGSAGRGGAPTVADFDGDGLMEIGVAGAFCYTVFDLGCTGAGTPAGCRGAGELWRTDTEDDSSNVTSSTVFDFNGDGRAEVIYNDEQYFQVLDGATGTIVFEDPNPSRTRTEQPIVADVDNDGNAEIVFVSNDEAAFAGDSIPAADRVPGIEIWSSADDSWVGARPIWNQHTYHIDNVDSVGVVPRNEAPSWATHNTYRLNVALEDALAAPNLGASTSTFDLGRCGEGVIRVCAEIHNRGEARVGPGLEVTFYDGDPDAGGAAIGTATTTRALDPGGAPEVVCIDWMPAPTEPRHVYVRVDSAGAERECIEDDNTVDLGEAHCPPFG